MTDMNQILQNRQNLKTPQENIVFGNTCKVTSYVCTEPVAQSSGNNTRKGPVEEVVFFQFEKYLFVGTFLNRYLRKNGNLKVI